MFIHINLGRESEPLFATTLHYCTLSAHVSDYTLDIHTMSIFDEYIYYLKNNINIHLNLTNEVLFY